MPTLYKYCLKCFTIFNRIRALIVFIFFKVRFRAIGKHSKIRGVEFFNVGDNAIVGDFCWIEAVCYYEGINFSPCIVLGKDVAMSDFVHISAVNSIEIDSGTLIGSKVYIGDHSHGHYQDQNLWNAEKNIMPKDRPLADIKPIKIGKNCWIGDGAVILAGTIIGDNCVIGANSVVKGSYKSNMLIGGIPAKVIKQLNKKKDNHGI